MGYVPGAVGAYGPIGKRRSAGLVILLAIVTCGIWQAVWSFQNGEELKQHRNEGLGGALHLVFALLVYPVTMFLMAGEVEEMYRKAGKQPPITTLWGLWFLLPLIGNIVWYLRIQRAINDHWTSLGAADKPGL
jgi:4-amino-4-deoxy-L-arabinose transferase-like glycosyltransferase